MAKTSPEFWCQLHNKSTVPRHMTHCVHKMFNNHKESEEMLAFEQDDDIYIKWFSMVLMHENISLINQNIYKGSRNNSVRWFNARLLKRKFYLNFKFYYGSPLMKSPRYCLFKSQDNVSRDGLKARLVTRNELWLQEIAFPNNFFSEFSVKSKMRLTDGRRMLVGPLI